MLNTIQRPGSGFTALPPEYPLDMPEQSLWKKPAPSQPPGTAAGTVPLRRFFVLAATIAMTLAGAHEIYQVLKVGGITIPEAVVMVLFLLLFAWIAFSFVSTVIGFVVILSGRGGTLAIDPTEPLSELVGRNAILLPTYNEEPARVMARLQAIYESVDHTGRGSQFAFFILSDTTDPDIWVAEEAAFLALRERTGSPRIYYRHRLQNTGRKAGNIAEWIMRFGGGYDHMIVLDADSLMTGDTIVRLAAAMERHRRVGLIQTLPVLLNGNTLFARIQQFAGRVYGPAIARGIAWWHGSEGNYWGHNAIIRVKAFAEQAGLPLLRGPKPFGGHVLSHDFVEAALMRRAGWGVHMAPELGGSYEECPPSITDYAVRDRRWCQGNLQHLGVLPARGLHWVSRLHLLTGIGSYITAPLWLLFLLTGILISLQAQFVRPEYFPAGATLFPQWPAQDPIRAAWVFAGTMALLIVPKLLGYVSVLLRARERRGTGGGIRAFVSVVLETLLSALIAPIMMLMQSRALAEIMLGRDSGWQAQQRDDGALPAADLIRRYAWPTVLGLALAAGAYAVSTPLFFWMTPVVAGLVLAVPIVALTSLPAVGRGLRASGLLLTPEERDPPAVLVRANDIAAGEAKLAGVSSLTSLLCDPELLEAHRRMLPTPEPRRRGAVDVPLVIALAKIEDAQDQREAIALLSTSERFAVLANNAALERLIAKPHGVNPAPCSPASV